MPLRAVYNECDAYSKFVPKTKPVFGVEYCDLGSGTTQVEFNILQILCFDNALSC